MSDRPAAQKAIMNSKPRNFCFPRPLCNRLGFVLVRQESISATLIIILNLARRPTAILWSVWAIIINSVQGFANVRMSHVFIKILKTLPSHAESYPSTAIVRVPTIMRIIAALFHISPNSINSSFVHSVPCRGFNSGASTTLTVAVHKSSRSNCGQSPTRTSAFPESAVLASTFSRA